MPERLDQTAAAEAISDGTSVDWDGLEASTDPSVRGVVAQLRIIGALAAVHRAEAIPGDLDAWGPLAILERVGEGSFGTVYRAHDPRLARDVALKLLKEAASDSASLVVEEGRLLARVRHPNVITVHGADIAGGRAGLWMEFIHGHTLEALVRANGPMTADEAVAIGRTLCGALTAVHAAGLVHGDVKAQNVMRELDGRLVLMDFGAGREVVEDAADVPLTGTPAYVAPELFGGGRPSAGTDVYALGVLLFHLVTGAYPTPGRSRTEVHAAAAARTRVRLRDVRADLPEAFVTAVEKAIAPHPSSRFSSAADLDRALAAIESSPTRGGDGTRASRSTRRGVVLAGVLLLTIAAAVASLGRWRSGSAATAVLAPERSLAVLPIVNQTQDPAMEYLADGITESLIRELSLAKGLRVTSRTSSMYFKNRPGTVRDLARQLDVDLAIESSLRVSGDHLDVEMTLVDARADRSLWTRRFVEFRSKPARLQADIALELRKQLGATPVSPARTADDEAYRWYLKGRYEWNKRTADGLNAAVEYFNKAVAVDPSYAAAHAGLAESYLLLGAFSWRPAADAFPLADAAARRALELDPGLSSPHAVKGYLLTGSYEPSAAYSEYLRAIELDPNNVTARQWYALSVMTVNSSEALRQIEIARRLDPMSKILSSDAAVVYKHVGRWDEAIAQLERTIQLYPDFAEGYIQLGNIYEQRGHAARAVEVFQKAAHLGRNNGYVLAAIAYNQAAAHDLNGARQTVNELEELAGHTYVPPGALAIAYASLGDETRAKTHLRQEASRDDIGKALTEAQRKPGLERLTQFARSLTTLER